MRNQEKDENEHTIKTARDGAAAVGDALKILQDFYDGAKKAKFIQVQASPIDADFANYGKTGKSGAVNKGNQAAGGGIIAMLDVIKSDFERTVKVTTEEEYAAAREFANFDTTTKATISTKETEKGQAEGDHTHTEHAITENMEDLGNHQTQLGDALKELESLKPTCVDTGMSYSDRVAKREEEIEALKNALCILDTDGVEEGC